MPRAITQPFVIASAILEKKGKILLVKENKPGWRDHGKWSNPGGWVELAESPEEAVKREVKEETGMEFTPTHMLGIYSLFRKELEKAEGIKVHAIKLVFIGKIGKKSGNLEPDVSEARWFLPGEIYKMDERNLRDQDIKQAVRDYFSGKRYPLDILRHTVSE